MELFLFWLIQYLQKFENFHLTNFQSNRTYIYSWKINEFLFLIIFFIKRLLPFYTLITQRFTGVLTMYKYLLLSLNAGKFSCFSRCLSFIAFFIKNTWGFPVLTNTLLCWNEYYVLLKHFASLFFLYWKFVRGDKQIPTLLLGENTFFMLRISPVWLTFIHSFWGRFLADRMKISKNLSRILVENVKNSVEIHNKRFPGPMNVKYNKNPW